MNEKLYGYFMFILLLEGDDGISKFPDFILSIYSSFEFYNY
jgi:hypothetical protein